MPIKYYKLLDLLNRRGILKTELKEMTGMGTATLAKLSNHEKISMDVIERICEVLEVQPGDIMEFFDESKD